MRLIANGLLSLSLSFSLDSFSFFLSFFVLFPPFPPYSILLPSLSISPFLFLSSFLLFPIASIRAVKKLRQVKNSPKHKQNYCNLSIIHVMCLYGWFVIPFYLLFRRIPLFLFVLFVFIHGFSIGYTKSINRTKFRRLYCAFGKSPIQQRRYSRTHQITKIV